MTEIEVPFVEKLLPHREEMLLIERVLEIGEDWVVACATPRAGQWYSDNAGAMPAWIGIELMAQSVAAWVGWQSYQCGESPKLGLLLGTRAFRAEVPSFESDVPLTIRAVVAFRESNGLGAFDCTIASGDRIVATSTIKAFEANDMQRFMEQHA